MSAKTVGVDGCPGGWAVFSLAGEAWSFEVLRSAQELCEKNSDARHILVDMPVGLPESADDARPEALVRKVLASRASTVFNCPCRQAVYAPPQEASAVNARVLGKRLSYQSISLMPKIRQLDTLLRQRPEFASRLAESHPELCFAMLSGAPVVERKRTPEGLARRLDILAQAWPGAYRAFACIRVPASQVAPDDVLDALCLAVTGQLALKAGLRSLPPDPPRDVCGLPMRMVYTRM